MLVTILFHLSALFSVQLIALTFAIFLFIYIKKQELAKWYTFIATALVSLVILTMLATFIGIICIAARPHEKPAHEEDRFNRREMRHHWRGYRDHDGYEKEEGDYGHERFRDWNKEGGNKEGGEEGKMGRGFHHRYMHDGSENWSMPEDRRIEVRDSIIKSKAPKK